MPDVDWAGKEWAWSPTWLNWLDSQTPGGAKMPDERDLIEEFRQWRAYEREFFPGRYAVSDANSRQEGGSHYRKTPGEQHWDRLVRLYGLPAARCYFIGNITAYVERYQDKNGIEDLRKARHYLDKLIEEEEKYKLNNSPPKATSIPHDMLCTACQGKVEEGRICVLCMGTGRRRRVETATHGAEPEPGEYDNPSPQRAKID